MLYQPILSSTHYSLLITDDSPQAPSSICSEIAICQLPKIDIFLCYYTVC